MKYLNNYNNFLLIKEEFDFINTIKNLFKSKETKDLEKNKQDWNIVFKQLTDIFTKNKNWNNILQKYGYDGDRQFGNFWKKFIDGIFYNQIYYPFATKKGEQNELSPENLTLLQKKIAEAVSERNNFKEIVDKIKTASDTLKLEWPKFKEGNEDILKFINDDNTLNQFNNLGQYFYEKLNFLGKLVNNLKKGSSIQFTEDDINKIEKIFNLKDDDLEINKKINDFKLTLSVLENWNNDKITEEYTNYLNKINKIKNLQEKSKEIEKLITSIKYINSDFKINGYNEKISNLCKILNVIPTDYTSEKLEEIEKIIIKIIVFNYNPDKIVSDSTGMKLSLESFKESLNGIPNKEEFLKKVSITTNEIIKENNLGTEDVYFTHSSRDLNLTKESINFEVLEEQRGEKQETTPVDIYGFYITAYQKGNHKDFDSLSYLNRSMGDSNVALWNKNSKVPILYIITLNPEAKFLKGSWVNFIQTNQSTKEFADYCKNLGFSGYYHPHPYGKGESALEIVIIDKDAITEFKKDENNVSRNMMYDEYKQRLSAKKDIKD